MKSPGGEIVQVQGSHIMRSTGRKDRHSKVHTAKGPRDRRVRLSAHTAIQFYDVQDRLGYDRPSKAVDWLIKKANSAIEKLAELPPLNPTPASDDPPDPTPGPPDPEAQPGIDPPEPPGGYDQFGGLSFFPAASESDHHNGLQTYQPPENPSAAADHLGLSLQSLYQAPAAPEQALFGFGPYHRVGELHGQDQAAGGGSGGFGAAAFNQRGTLQSSSSFSQHVRAWDDLPAAASSAQRPHHQIHPHQSLSSSIFGTRFFSDAGGGGFPVFYIPATIHGEDEGHGFILERPSSSSSHPNSTHR